MTQREPGRRSTSLCIMLAETDLCRSYLTGGDIVDKRWIVMLLQVRRLKFSLKLSCSTG